MQKILMLIISVMVILAQPACVTSLQPLATPGTMIMDKRLSGEWNDGKMTMSIQPLIESNILREDDGSRKLELGETEEEIAFNSKTYLITIKQKDMDYLMIGAVSKINDQLFVDMISLGGKDPKKPEVNGSVFEFSENYLRTFSIAKLEFAGDNKVVIKYLNGDFIKEQVSKGNLKLKHEKDNLFDSFLITASSFELKQFLEKYGHDERLYQKEESIILTRKG